MSKNWTCCCLIVAAFLNGCAVSREKLVNWQPADDARNPIFYQCHQECQQMITPGTISTPQGYSSTPNSEYVCNKKLLASCMASNNYRLRAASDFETFWSFLTFPVAFAFAFGGFDGDFY